MSAKIPKYQSDITNEWLKNTLESSLSNENVEVIEITFLENKNGCLSKNTKAKVVINGQVKNLFIKSMVEPDDPFRPCYDGKNQEEIEIKFYNEYLLGLVNFANEETNGDENISTSLQTMVPKFYGGGFCQENGDRGFFAILEDLSDQFVVKKMSDGFTYTQLDDIFKKLANFHAVSYAFILKHPEKISQWDLRFPGQLAKSKTLIEKCFGNLAKDKPDLLASLQSLEEVWIENFAENQTIDKRFISHGDLWLNNIMVKNDSNETMILDWQTLCYLHPVIDIITLLCTSVTMENIGKWTLDLVKIYHDTFDEVCRAMEVNVPFDLKDLHGKFCDHNFIFFILNWKSQDSSKDPYIELYNCIMKYCHFFENEKDLNLPRIIQFYRELSGTACHDSLNGA